MTMGVVALVVALGWAVRHARVPRRTRPPTGSPQLGRAASTVERWCSRRRAGGQVDAEVAPLLRFRTAIERGGSPAQAFESVAAGSGPWATGARRLVARVRAGAGVQDAVDAWVAEDPDPSLRLLADALAISSGTGGSHVRAVDAVIGAARERAALRREIRALASQAHTSALVLVLLPIGFAVAIAALDARVRAFYLGSALGPVCVVAGGLLDAAGAWLMLRMVRGVA